MNDDGGFLVGFVAGLLIMFCVVMVMRVSGAIGPTDVEIRNMRAGLCASHQIVEKQNGQIVKVKDEPNHPHVKCPIRY